MTAFPFMAVLLTSASSGSSPEIEWLWQFVDVEENDGPRMRQQILRGAKEIARLLHETRGEGEGEGDSADGNDATPAPPAQFPPTPVVAQPTPSPPTALCEDHPTFTIYGMTCSRVGQMMEDLGFVSCSQLAGIGATQQDVAKIISSCLAKCGTCKVPTLAPTSSASTSAPTPPPTEMPTFAPTSPGIASEPTPTPAPTQSPPTPSPPTSTTPSLAQPTPSPSTRVSTELTPSPPTPVEFGTKLAEAAHAGQRVIQVEDLTGLALGMSLTISDDNNSETKTIIAVTEGSGRRLVERRLAMGSVTLDSVLKHSYEAGVSVTAVPQQDTTASPTPATPAPSDSRGSTTTTTSFDLIDEAGRTNLVTRTFFAMQVAMVWFSMVPT